MSHQYEEKARQGKAERVSLRANGFETECFFSAQGKLTRKIECWSGGSLEFRYEFDGKGHLLGVERGGIQVERYAYDRDGRRIESRREPGIGIDLARGRLDYDSRGRLVRAGDVTFDYDGRGALSERRDREGVTRFVYNGDTMPDEILPPDGRKIRYEYAKTNPIGPAKRFRNDLLTSEYQWLDPLRLAVFRDHDSGLEQRFFYDEKGALDRLRLTLLKPDDASRDTAGFGYMDALLMQGRRERLRELLNPHGGTLDLFCGRDQVGTLRTLTDARGRLIKEIRRDSFGALLRDSFLELFVPVGFAGGLVDPDTGLTRFGWRDYDPAVGRFTAPDPARDMRGDGDIYDYCVDDPVTMRDSSGLAGEEATKESKMSFFDEMLCGYSNLLLCPHDDPRFQSAVRQVSKASSDWGRTMLIHRYFINNPVYGIGSKLIPEIAPENIGRSKGGEKDRR